jgi:hypothetical protein
VTSVAYFITPQWTWGAQLGLTGVFSFYAALSYNPDFLVAVRAVASLCLVRSLARAGDADDLLSRPSLCRTRSRGCSTCSA